MHAEIVRRAALWRVRLCAATLIRLARLPAVRPVLARLAAFAVGRGAAARWLLGFRRPFPTLAAATAAADSFLVSAHQTRTNRRQHLHFAAAPRLSDYPAIFHLSRIEGDFRVFDLGGNVGTLFYCYRRYLPNIDRLRWVVFDLPETVRLGRRLARRRGVADRLTFVDDLDAADGAEVFLASGSLHYFERPLPALLATLHRRPFHVIVNRTPLNDGPAVATVQDAGFGLAACVIHDRHALVHGMAALGYGVSDQWSIHDMALHIPLRPELSAAFYRGFHFSRA